MQRGAGLEPGSQDSRLPRHPLCGPGGQLTNTVHQTRTEPTDERGGLRTCEGFSCEPKCASVIALCVGEELPRTPRLAGKGLIYEDSLGSTSWLTTWSFERFKGRERINRRWDEAGHVGGGRGEANSVERSLTRSARLSRSSFEPEFPVNKSGNRNWRVSSPFFSQIRVVQ